LIAAIENGADAVYFGLQGHNARARATNFDVAALTETMATLHARGVKGYVTLNTLVFPDELDDVETVIRKVAAAGVDAVIVQDLGLARMIRAICPDLEIHASTQMSVTSSESLRLAEELGCTRVILARELSLKEIAKVRDESNLPVEVFVHGALCVAYSGQCLTSEALGGRSANRGECAQACRMPYQIICDGKLQDLDAVQYLLSPQDLAAYDLIPQLIDVGVSSLKIEGRLKTPEYVANITRHYRSAIDDALSGRPQGISRDDVREMELSFSRGFSHGFFDGMNHKVLVRGDYAKKRGVYLGHIEAIVGTKVRLNLAAPIKPGDGVVFDGNASDDVPEQGGRVYDVARPARHRQPAVPAPDGGLSAGLVELGFGHRDLDLKDLHIGQRVWKTDDPELTKRLRKTFEGPSHRKVNLDLDVYAVAGEPLRLSGKTATDFTATVVAESPLAVAERQVATIEQIREGLDRLGDTLYTLGTVTTKLEGSPMVPKSLLNSLRRDLTARLDALAKIPPQRSIATEPVLPTFRAALKHERPDQPPAPTIAALCRNTRQIEAAIKAGVKTIYAEYQDIKLYPEAVAASRKQDGVEIFIATPRIQKPGEANIFKFLARLGADGLLVRNAGGLYYCADEGIPFVADFSLNASNELTVEFLKAKGALRVTASYDLSADQLDDLLLAIRPEWLEVVIHQQIPMFHMEHCVFCAFLSPGTDATNCGRPCDEHDVKLRDRVGMEHPLKADVGCRNTLYNALPQTSAEYLPRFLHRGARNLRVEFLDDSPEAVTRILGLYRDALSGRREVKNLWRDLKATSKYGVTRGALAILE
jgi:putative protease